MYQLENIINTVINDDCLNVLKDLPDRSIDLVLTDPPYGQTSLKWDKKCVDIVQMWKEFNRIITDNGIVIMTAIQPFATKIISENFENFKYDLIWDKGNTTGFLDAKKKPLRRHEIILIFSKATLGNHIYNPIMKKGIPRWKGASNTKNTETVYGKKKPVKSFNDTYYPQSILNFGTVYRNNFLHPTQKPIDLLRYLVKTYSNENDIILDPFLGSGTTAVAAKQLHRRFIGIEISERYCQIARERLRQGILF